jgi:hypothetical protein
MSPLLVMEMQTGNTNNHTSQIFFVLAAPMYWREWLVAPVLMVPYKGKCHVSSTIPNRQAFTIHLAGVSGKRNRFNTRWRQNSKTNGHLSPRSQAYSEHLQ